MDEKKRCPYCGEEILAVARKCKYCGEWLDREPVQKNMIACPICGEMIEEGTKVCPFCNEEVSYATSNVPQINGDQATPSCGHPTIDENVVRSFINSISKFSNQRDIFVGAEISEIKRVIIKRKHQISMDHEIYFYRIFDQDISFVIYDEGISNYHANDETVYDHYSWKCIDRVTIERVKGSPYPDNWFVIHLKNMDVDTAYIRSYQIIKLGKLERQEELANTLTLFARNFNQ